MAINEKLKKIIKEYWGDFQKKKECNCVVRPSVPIVWFGDITAYLNSPKKILTVALNPSDKEFRKDKNDDFSFFRFPECEKIYKQSKLNNSNMKLLCESYNMYFTDNRTYKKWFIAYEKLLNFLNASYYENNYKNHAIHIDAYTGIATAKPWGQLKADEQKSVSNISLFKNLLSYLEPDIILVSINIPAFNEVFNTSNQEPDFSEFAKQNDKWAGYIRVFKNHQLFEEKECLIIHGKNRNLPFQGAGCTYKWKEKVFKEIITNYNLND